ncbi:hypothetical protein [Nocardioides sp. B-3]|uniref:hypothetical protein n=1 Tax=Nocardioides sp. B-3 TaxID=2895565 RepID=UPI002152A82D|nr:hypothetical protein [Nocardioides sp. B-3]UUZ58315.1 hypothetical protein LP418_19125 [Nocardioides sp. B-3]
MNDPETRLAYAPAARADLVRPEDLRDEPLPAPVVPLWRRTPVVPAAAACPAVIATTTAVVVTRGDADRPQPTDPSPTLELPPDIGLDWDPAKASTPAELDLDGDGTPEKVRFLGEPTKEYDGRVRVQTILSSDGSIAFGIIDVGTTIGVTAPAPDRRGRRRRPGTRAARRQRPGAGGADRARPP